jgi:hypothetical protein
VSTDRARQILEEVKANQAKLNGCPGPHDFEDTTPDKLLGKRFRCRRCAGELEGLHARWYMRGLEHGRAVSARAMMPTLREGELAHVPIPDDTL